MPDSSMATFSAGRFLQQRGNPYLVGGGQLLQREGGRRVITTLHGFRRDVDGSITRFDAPDIGRGILVGTSALSLNTAGTITGCF